MKLRFSVSIVPVAGPAAAQDMPGMAMPPAAPATPAASAPAVPPPVARNAMAGMDMAGMDRGGHAMVAGLGPYPMTREASGTSWQSDNSTHEGVHLTAGRWQFMLHATLNGVYDNQEGPRGASKGFASGMVMGVAKRAFDNGDVLQLRGMLSPDPLMGPSGYPLLLATGETADGKTALVDRQHPHDLFIELSESYRHKLSKRDSIFVYAGLPGEPAFGPTAFMHRLSIMDSPEAPISHHWLDSTHITFGVVTAGFVHGSLKLEASRYHGREPDQHRYDIEVGALDSTAVRLSWNPTRTLSLQGSWTRQISPEKLNPHDTKTKWSASAIYTVPVGARGYWATTAAFGRRLSEGAALDAYVLECAVKFDAQWTVFARAESVANAELLAPAGGHGAAYTVGKASVGAIRDFPLATHVKFGVSGLYARNFVPAGLDAAYGGNRGGAMGFVRLKID